MRPRGAALRAAPTSAGVCTPSFSTLNSSSSYKRVMWCSLTVMISLVACAAAAPRCASLDDVIQSRSDLARLKELKRTIQADVQREFAQRNGTQLTFFAPDDAAWAAVSA